MATNINDNRILVNDKPDIIRNLLSGFSGNENYIEETLNYFAVARNNKFNSKEKKITLNDLQRLVIIDAYKTCCKNITSLNEEDRIYIYNFIIEKTSENNSRNILRNNSHQLDKFIKDENIYISIYTDILIYSIEQILQSGFNDQNILTEYIKLAFKHINETPMEKVKSILLLLPSDNKILNQISTFHLYDQNRAILTPTRCAELYVEEKENTQKLFNLIMTLNTVNENKFYELFKEILLYAYTWQRYSLDIGHFNSKIDDVTNYIEQREIRLVIDKFINDNKFSDILISSYLNFFVKDNEMKSFDETNKEFQYKKNFNECIKK